MQPGRLGIPRDEIVIAANVIILRSFSDQGLLMRRDMP
jgi:hypothetical protein